MLIFTMVINYLPLFFHWPVVWTVPRLVAVGQVVLSLALCLVIGGWSHRLQVDDEEFLSKENGATIFSRLTFSWMNPLINKGNKEPLEQADLWNLVDEDKAELVLKEYSKFRYGLTLFNLLEIENCP